MFFKKKFDAIWNRLSMLTIHVESLKRWDYNFVYNKCSRVDPLLNAQIDLSRRIKNIEDFIAKACQESLDNHEKAKAKSIAKVKPKAKKRIRK